ncbi:MAG: pyrroline-5-carboxylate reductase [Verrucomicrobiia bacterium]
MTYGFLGAGRMATAIIRGMLSAGVCSKTDIVVSDTDEAKLDLIGSETGVISRSSNRQVAEEADVLLLCVKPDEVLAALRGCGELSSSTLLVSIAAGVTIGRLETIAVGCRVVRVMPNTPALIHRGAAAYALGTHALESDADIVQEIFSAVGLALRVDERHLDAVTGLSGSGPAFVYLMVEALADGGVAAGLPRQMALQLAAQTLAGGALMVLETGEHPAILKENVASPGGTTIAGLQVLEDRGLRGILMQGVLKATNRSREIGVDLARSL